MTDSFSYGSGRESPVAIGNDRIRFPDPFRRRRLDQFDVVSVVLVDTCAPLSNSDQMTIVVDVCPIGKAMPGKDEVRARVAR